MNISHVHAQVKDLEAAIGWLERVWDIRPTFQNGQMASMPFGALTVIFDAAPADTPLTVGLDSKNCDADFHHATSRGAVALETPADRPWGVRAAYVQGPGAVKFEFEQMLS